MTVETIIRETKEKCSEWLEMTNDPAIFIARVLAQKIIDLQGYIEYLEKRIENESSEK